jgi:hypothetical protein
MMMDTFISSHFLLPPRRERRCHIRAQHILQDMAPFPPRHCRLWFLRELGLVASKPDSGGIEPARESPCKRDAPYPQANQFQTPYDNVCCDPDRDHRPVNRLVLRQLLDKSYNDEIETASKTERLLEGNGRGGSIH